MDLKTIPLATRMRPERIEEVLGQDHILGPSRALRRSLDTGQSVFNNILGTTRVQAKQPIARLIAQIQ